MGQAQVGREEVAFDLGEGGECDEKDKRDWRHSSGRSSPVRSAYIASAIPRQRFDIVGRQGASPYRATTNTRERCWRPPQTSQACISPWISWPRRALCARAAYP